jgi:hypothetical protein
MKNNEVIQLVNAGILGITAHSLPPAQAYKIYKFKKAIRSAYNLIAEGEIASLEELGINDAKAFDARLEQLRKIEVPLPKQVEELNAKQGILDRLNEVRNSLYTDDAILPEIKAIPYEDWHKLQEENSQNKVGKHTVDVLSGEVEFLLEGILWTPIED